MKKMNIVKFLTVFLILFAGTSVQSFAQEEEEKDGFKFGGAMRYNIYDKSWVDNKTQPMFTWDTWRLNVDGTMKGLDLSFEYRFYPTFATHFIHHGWIGYEFNDNVYMKLGVNQVPFGITKYASHSWWFQGVYYVGLEDDYDMGIKFDLDLVDNLDLAVAYYRQAEPEGPASGNVNWGHAGTGRYSYDVTPTDSIQMRELNQANVRAAYHVTDDIEVGLSAQVGQNYNAVNDLPELSTAFAAHVLANYQGFNFKGEFVNYNYQAKDKHGNKTDIIPMGAYGDSYDVASKASLIVAGLAYSIDVDLGPISNIQPYVDYTYTDKANSDFYDTEQLVPGMLITAGSIYTYVDYAMGKNHPWFAGSLGAGEEDAEWNKRFNINIGYYF